MSKPAAKPKKAVPDWEKIENDYRAGVLSVREIGANRGVSHTAINKRAKRDGWTRDLAAKIKARAESLVSTRAVSTKVATEATKRQLATDREIIEANADLIAQIRLGHRKDIGRARKQAMSMLDELEAAGSLAAVEREKLITALIAGTFDAGGDKDDAKLRLIELDKLLQLPTRSGVMKALADTMVKLVGLEREAYSLETAKKPGDGDGGEVVDQLRGMLKSIDGSGTGLPAHASPAA